MILFLNSINQIECAIVIHYDLITYFLWLIFFIKLQSDGSNKSFAVQQSQNNISISQSSHESRAVIALRAWFLCICRMFVLLRSGVNDWTRFDYNTSGRFIRLCMYMQITDFDAVYIETQCLWKYIYQSRLRIFSRLQTIIIYPSVISHFTYIV